MLSKISQYLHPYRTLYHIFYAGLLNFVLRDESFRRFLDFELRGEVRRRELINHAMTKDSSGITDRIYVQGRQVIVSLTTHGNRIYEAFLAIESIMDGTCRPNRIILWLPSNEFTIDSLPEVLQMQQKRGLEIRFVEDLGPHTKLVPAMQQFPEDVIITIDDDIYYSYDMVENLIKSYRQHPHAISANRVAVMCLNEHHQLEPYFKWKHYIHPESTTPNNFIIGSEGCLYPPHCFNAEVFNESVFKSLCPYADDVWFTAMAIYNQTPVKHLYTHYDRGCAGSVENKPLQESGLVHINEADDAYLNNKQISDVFMKYNLFQYLS